MLAQKDDEFLKFLIKYRIINEEKILNNSGLICRNSSVAQKSVKA